VPAGPDRAPPRALVRLARAGARAPAVPPAPDVASLLEQRPEREHRLHHVLQRPSQDLAARLDADDLRRIEQQLEDPQLREWWYSSPDASRLRFALVAAAYYRDERVLAKTGLRSDVPPETVHAMTRGPVSAGGDPWMADVVVGALDRAAVPLDDGAAVLDFGCSSGRAVRVLAAWRPQIRWIGCDPNADAIAWARDHLPGVEFFVSPQEPPLDLDAGCLHAVYAISVWSHFSAGAALRWLAEMHRILRPGGALVITTHGLDAVAYFARHGRIGRDDAARYVTDLLAHGHAYADAFGPEGDWGVKGPDWGQAFMMLDWLMENATPAWSLRDYQPGGLQSCQDVIVLTRELAAAG